MSKIQKIKRKDLDLERYSKALHSALNYRIYAEYWYLDIQTNEKWECWVYGDYEVLMPVPLQYKFGFKFVAQPFYSQQLGVFYKNEISKELFAEFENKLHRQIVRAYQFNEENTFAFSPKGEKRVNQILNLNKPFEIIKKGFYKDREKDIRRNSKLNLTLIEAFDFEMFFKLRLDGYAELESLLDIKVTKDFIRSLIDSKLYKGFTLLNDEQQVLAMCLFSVSKSRLILQFSARNKLLEPKGAFAFMINLIIEKYSNQELIFDFEGSSVEGIAYFNESFGAKKEFYTKFKTKYLL